MKDQKNIGFIKSILTLNYKITYKEDCYKLGSGNRVKKYYSILKFKK